MLETKQSLEYPEYVDRFEDGGGGGGRESFPKRLLNDNLADRIGRLVVTHKERWLRVWGRVGLCHR